MLNVRDYCSFQDAYDALPAKGGTIFVPAGTYDSRSSTRFTGLKIDTKPIILIGESNGPGNALSILVHDSDGAEDKDAIWLNVLGGCAVKNLHIKGKWNSDVLAPGWTPGSGRGIKWYVAGRDVHMAGLSVENVIVEGSPNLAFEFVCDGHSNSYVSKLEMIQCTAYHAASGGSLLLGGGGTDLLPNSDAVHDAMLCELRVSV